MLYLLLVTLTHFAIRARMAYTAVDHFFAGCDCHAQVRAVDFLTSLLDSNNIAVACAKSAHHQSAYQTDGSHRASYPPGTSSPVCTIALCIAAAARTGLGKSTPCLTKQQLHGRRPRLRWDQCASSLAYISAIASWNACLAWGRLSLNVGVMRPFSTEKGSGVRYTACTCRAVTRSQRRLRMAWETLQSLCCA